MNIEKQVNDIIKQGCIRAISEEILDNVRERLATSDGIVVVELHNGNDIIVQYSTSSALAVYAVVIAKQLLVDEKISEMETTENDDEEIV